jgi:galactose mutarotase-like enzyme
VRLRRSCRRQPRPVSVEVVDQHASDLGAQYQQARSDRAALVLRIDAWHDPADGDANNRNAVLARLAGISRQAVLSLRERALEVNAADRAEHCFPSTRAISSPNRAQCSISSSCSNARGTRGGYRYPEKLTLTSPLSPNGGS